VADILEQARADILAFTAYPKGAVAADLVQQPTGMSSTSASFETTVDTNVILRRYATSYMIPEKRVLGPRVTAPSSRHGHGFIR
jgi:hypothetical protein